MDFFLLFLTVLYVCALLVAKRGWHVVSAPRTRHHEKPLVSVIVPFRNEASNLVTLLQALKAQTYTHFEVLLIDDHSEDNYREKMQTLLEQSSTWRCLPSNGTGKKHAITTGVNHAKGVIVITTDADCVMEPEWIESMVAHFDSTCQMVCGGVSMTGNRTNLFHQLQSIEWCSLVGVTAASIGYNRPVMCNGANLAFRKSVFDEVNGYEGNLAIASGDDEFLMRKIQSQYPSGIYFSSSATSVVKTTPLDTISSFYQQRLRWAQKWKFNTSPNAIIMAFTVLTYQILWIVLFWRAAFMHNEIAMCCLVLRALAEVFFLYPVANFLRINWSWIAFLFLQGIYPVYVLTVGILSNVVSIQWRGRKIA
jgi:biofilm PGA synthesis N-glycosyltransferase PgaC